MELKRTNQLGHFFTLIFTGILLFAGRNFLIQNPLIGAVILIIFSGVYIAAVYTSEKSHFLYPVVILLFTSYSLILHFLNVDYTYFPLFSIIFIAALLSIALYMQKRDKRELENSLFGGSYIIIIFFTLLFILKIGQFFEIRPLSAVLTLAAYSTFHYFRFRDNGKLYHIISSVSLVSGSYLFLLHKFTSFGFYFLALSITALAVYLFLRREKPGVELLLFLSISVYLVLQNVSGISYQFYSTAYISFSLILITLGAQIFRISPKAKAFSFYLVGIVLIILGMTIFNPWKDYFSGYAALYILCIILFGAGPVIIKREFSVISIIFGRFLILAGIAASVTGLIFSAAYKFPLLLPASLISSGMVLVNIAAAFNVRVFQIKWRNLYVYLAGLYLILAFFTFLYLIRPFYQFAPNLYLSVLLISLIYAVGYMVRNLVDEHMVNTIYDTSTLTAIAVPLIYFIAGKYELTSALVLSLVISLPAVLVYSRIKKPGILFPLASGAGLLIYYFTLISGLAREVGALPFLIAGIILSAVALYLEIKANPLKSLFYFSWIIFSLASITLSYPFKAMGAYMLALWSASYLVTSRIPGRERDRILSIFLEVAGLIILSVTIFFIIYNQLWYHGVFILFFVSLTHIFMTWYTRNRLYLYVGTIALVAGYFLTAILIKTYSVYLLYSFPLTAVLLALGFIARRRDFRSYASPLEISANLQALLGTILFLVFIPFSKGVIGWAAGSLYLALYLALTYFNNDRRFLLGAALAFCFTYLQILTIVPGVTSTNILSLFIPVTIVLLVLGIVLKNRGDYSGSWSLFAAAIIVALSSDVFSVWGGSNFYESARIVLIISSLIWVSFLLLFRYDIFIYTATLTLAFLAYNFVQSSTDTYSQSLVSFFLYGILILGAVFIFVIVRKYFRFRKPILFVEQKKWHHVLIYFTPTVILVALTLGGFVVESTSNPIFCGTCHSMKSYYSTWSPSRHAESNVGCADCHYEPGVKAYVKTKLKGFSEMVRTLTGTEGYKPEAQVSDQGCLKSNCHTRESLGKSLNPQFKYLFSHPEHIDKKVREIALRCTSCHSHMGGDSHISVNKSTCYTCHFKGKGREEASFGNCLTCHELPAYEVGEVSFSHTDFYRGRELRNCQDCHEHVTVGDAPVAEERCYTCHTTEPSRLLKTDRDTIHTAHTVNEKIECIACHERILHGEKVSRTVMTEDCSGCHGDLHSTPERIYSGKGGMGVESMPAPMWLAGVTCSGCHKKDLRKIDIEIVKEKCNSCHEEGYGEFVDEWRADLSLKLERISILMDRANAVLGERKTPEIESLFESASVNVGLVKEGNGIHNVQYAETLLKKAEQDLNRIIGGR